MNNDHPDAWLTRPSKTKMPQFKNEDQSVFTIIGLFAATLVIILGSVYVGVMIGEAAGIRSVYLDCKIRNETVLHSQLWVCGKKDAVELSAIMGRVTK